MKMWLCLILALVCLGCDLQQDISFDDPEAGRWGRLGPYALWDAFLRVRPIRNLSLWLNVENLLDVAYQIPPHAN